jgi:hypothetical protein
MALKQLDKRKIFKRPQSNYVVGNIITRRETDNKPLMTDRMAQQKYEKDNEYMGHNRVNKHQTIDYNRLKNEKEPSYGRNIYSGGASPAEPKLWQRKQQRPHAGTIPSSVTAPNHVQMVIGLKKKIDAAEVDKH